jgi:pimeloyl-ACP methyl ester carboxylesterase
VSDSFAVSLPSGAEIIGEGDREDTFLGWCILLHDEGHDLDQMRPMAAALRAARFSVLLVDLPGHGLSSGSLALDGPHVIDALLGTLPGDSPRAVVAEGSSADVVLASAAGGSLTAYVLLSPRMSLPAQAVAQAPIRHVPSLVILDPQDEAAVQVTEALRAHARATWGRIFAHRQARSDSGGELWQLRAGESTARFLAEKAAFARHRRGSHARGEPGSV